MTTPPRPTGSPDSDATQGSYQSARSTASSFKSVRVDSKGKAKTSTSAVPGKTPDLPEGKVGAYVQNPDAAGFYAIDKEKGFVQRWNETAQGWGKKVARNKGRIAKALIDSVPALLQGGSAMIPNETGKKVVKGAGIASQFLLGGKGLVTEGQNYLAGNPVDMTNVATDLVRYASGGMNLYGGVGNQDDPKTGIVDGAGTFFGGAATGVSTMYHATTDPGPQKLKDEESEPVYEMDSLVHSTTALNVSGTDQTAESQATRRGRGRTAPDPLSPYEPDVREYARWWADHGGHTTGQHAGIGQNNEHYQQVAEWYLRVRQQPQPLGPSVMSGGNNSDFTNSGYTASNTNQGSYYGNQSSQTNDQRGYYGAQGNNTQSKGNRSPSPARGR
ncbi:hypothetical protein ACFWP7_09410 [Streptomyces sp. NPDC058470]|uniref:hypothetical protein n=1 Tax=Streptomyces sp. NPDC058470 TaxID=3346515 RepID=UPI00364879D3